MDIQISVVIPTWKRPNLLLKCLEALLDQDFEKKAFEIIVVSDGPDKLTKDALSTWQYAGSQHIQYVNTPEKKGPAAARNYGWLNAKSKLIAFTDDDCLPDKNWLKAFWHAYQKENATVFTGQTVVPLSEKPTDYERNVAGLQNADFITANCCCPKKILFIIGGFDEQFGMAWREDSDLEFQLIKAHIPIRKISGALVVHPVRPAKWGMSIKEQRKTLYNALLYKKHPLLYRKKIQPVGPLNYYVIVAAALLIPAGIIFNAPALMKTAFTLWLALSLLFVIKRLRSTRLTISHVTEMAVTSLLIPFLSVYWQFYGAVKYRVFFI